MTCSQQNSFERVRSADKSGRARRNSSSSNELRSIQCSAETALRPLNHFEFEMFRSTNEEEWRCIERASVAWQSIADRYPEGFVVRIKCVLNGGDPNKLTTRIKHQLSTSEFASKALDVVGRFSEFSVSEESPSRYCATILVVYPTREVFVRAAFERSLANLIDRVNDPYITLEMLDSFLVRRSYGASETDFNSAMRLLEYNLRQLRPSSSLFLKLSSSHADECLELLRQLCSTNRDLICDVLGERSVHKLAVSYTSRLTGSSPEEIYDIARQILETGADSESWGYVAFNTLMRMAQSDDAAHSSGRFRGLQPNDKNSRVHALNEMILESSLDPLDKMALRVMSNEGPIGFIDERFERVWRIITRPDDRINDEDFAFLHALLDSGSPSACHLTSILLRYCVDLDNYNIGWRVASSVRSISKQVFGEVVHLCSKAYFKEVKMASGNPGVWFSRVRWCVERQLQFLNRYPCGLALHIASHSRQFETCWRWFTSMRVELAFRLTGYHTSAVLKAASYARNLDNQIDKIKEAYLMTPSNEKSTFTFVPMTRVWEYTSEGSHQDESSFWAEVAKDIRKCVNTYRRDKNRDRKVSRVMQRLGQWEESFSRWHTASSQKDTLLKPSPLGAPLLSSSSLQSSGNVALRPNTRSFQMHRSSSSSTNISMQRQDSAPSMRRSFKQSSSADLSNNNLADVRARPWSNSTMDKPLLMLASKGSGLQRPSVLHMQRFSSSGSGQAAISSFVHSLNDPFLVAPRDTSAALLSKLPNETVDGQPRDIVRRVPDNSEQAPSSSAAVPWPVMKTRQSSLSLSMSSWAPSIWNQQQKQQQASSAETETASNTNHTVAW